MRYLFLHNAFPGQFGHLAAALARDPDNQVVFASAQSEGSLPNIRHETYAAARPVRPSLHPYLRWMEGAVLTGQAVYRLGHQLKEQGFTPDIIYAHSGWGPALYIRELFPTARMVGYFEWFYQAGGEDSAFLGQDFTPDDRCRVATRNAALLMDLANVDAAITPTLFQRDRFPKRMQPLLEIVHDGVDTDFFHPALDVSGLTLPGLDLPGGTEIVTYATRGMEPYRGFPQFLRTADLLLRRRPNLHVVIAGEDRVHYGERLPQGDSWKRRMLTELPEIDSGRLHFVGTLPADHYRLLLQASSAHVYLTVPFVLSWSLLDAMACGCAVIGSDTAPIREVVKDGENGLLVDFFSPTDMAARIEEVLDHPALAARLRIAARQTAMERYALKDLLPKQLAILRG